MLNNNAHQNKELCSPMTNIIMMMYFRYADVWMDDARRSQFRSDIILPEFWSTMGTGQHVSSWDGRLKTADQEQISRSTYISRGWSLTGTIWSAKSVYVGIYLHISTYLSIYATSIYLFLLFSLALSQREERGRQPRVLSLSRMLLQHVV